jgi:O-antigen/teichoic acid export membrane protein
MAITTVSSVIVSGRYELAILLPTEDDDAINIVILSITLTTISSTLLLIIIVFFNKQITDLLGNSEISLWLYLTPIMVFSTGIYQSLNYWFNRKQQYRQLAINRISRSGLTVLSSLFLGISRFVNGGLILSAIVGQGVTTLNFVIRAYKEDKHRQGTISQARILASAKRYQNFPKYSVPADVINAASTQLPIILLTIFFGPVIVGYLHLTQRVLGAPFSIISSAFGDVFKQRASRDFNATGTCQKIWMSTFKQLLLISILPFIIIGFTAPTVFAAIFGEPWREAGRYAQILTPYYFLAFTVSPLSRTLYVTEKQKYDLFWQIGLFILTNTGILIGCWLNIPIVSIGVFSISYSLMYLIYLRMSYTFAAGRQGIS